MAATVQYDDENLQRLFTELDTKKRLKALRGAFRREANRVRKAAINNLRGSIRSNKDLEQGIRAVVFKRKAGFRVTIGTKKAGKNGKGERGYYISRRRKKKSGDKDKPKGKPVLIWTETGTAQRRTKTKTRFFTRSRKGHSTGCMKRYGFMAKTKNQVEHTVDRQLKNEIADQIRRIAKKYGCT